MKVDLTDGSVFGGVCSRFDKPHIDFNKPINFVFGKNGTGKSSICKLIKEQVADGEADVYVFQGFESVIDGDRSLNAIVLGEENVAINREIKDCDARIDKIQKKIKEEQAKIIAPEDGKDNLYTQQQALERRRDSKKKEEQKFYTESAKAVCNVKNPILVENPRTYDKNSFYREIDVALGQAKLSNYEIGRLKATEQATRKPDANEITLDGIDFAALQDEIGNLLQETVQPAIIIPELENSWEKEKFARIGKDCHKPDDKCAFCGGPVTSERLAVLESYFSGSEIKNFENKIQNRIKYINEHIITLSSISIDKTKFYPDFEAEVDRCAERVKDIVREQQGFFEHCISSLERKQKNLFNAVEVERKEVPQSLAGCIEEYNKIVKQNNQYSQELEDNKRQARNRLRYDKIAEIVRSSNIYTLQAEIKKTEEQIDEKAQEIAAIKDIINKLEDDRRGEEKKKNKLLEQTKNPEKLAKNINKKLKAHANFQLVYIKRGGREMYEIKEHINGEDVVRPIEELSTGEKNIIAFLYFIESLKDANKDHTKPKLIVLDDPMNSNDDTMQYLMVDDIQKIVKRFDKKETSDKLILLTHNVLFYLNVTRDIKIQYARKVCKDGSTVNPYDECNFYRLMSCDSKTTIQKIQSASQDFKNQYESLWYELYFLYHMGKPELMCNPIRRIIESYMSFTQNYDFYKENKDAKHLFNTGSHAVTDATTDPIGKTKDDIKGLLEECFKNNGVAGHFKKYWEMAKSAYSADTSGKAIK